MAGGSYCFTVNVVGRRGNDLSVGCIAELREAIRHARGYSGQVSWLGVTRVKFYLDVLYL